jgi:isovaleryl-CoA dehydrogenase
MIADGCQFLHNVLTPLEQQWYQEALTIASSCINANNIEQHDKLPSSLWQVLGSHKLLGFLVPTLYGGTAGGYVKQVLTMAALSRYSAAVGLSYAAHAHLCIRPIVAYGTDAQKQRYLPLLCSGAMVGSLAMTEPNAGSDITSLQLSATPTSDGFVLNGTKQWITNAPCADVMVVFARTGSGKKDITAFLTEPAWQGITVSEPIKKMGMRGSPTGTVTFKDCWISQDAILPYDGMGILMQGLDYERVVLAAGPMGILHACLADCCHYVGQRRQFGQAIGAFQLVQAKIAAMYSDLQAVTAHVCAMARHCDIQAPTRAAAAAVIDHASNVTMQHALEAIQCFGAQGYLADAPVNRYARDAKLYHIGAGTKEIRALLMARFLLPYV